VIGRRGRDRRAVHVSVVLGGALGVRLRGAGVSLATLDIVFGAVQLGRQRSEPATGPGTSPEQPEQQNQSAP
jgi:hypothetical protein